MTTPHEEARAVYERFRRVFGGARPRAARRSRTPEEGTSAPFEPGRDPHGLGDVIDGLTERMGWEAPLSQSELYVAWPSIVGPETAAHSEPVGIDDEGMLTVQCDSTAWATQLRLMRSRVLTVVLERYPAAGIRALRFVGPDAPSWKRGPRSIPGRGPRDTYG
jgi:predicted nucleic acid-binding Zn ribbon protein